MTNATKGLSRPSLGYCMSVLQRAQAKLRATAQDSRDLELADAVDEPHTELWFWQSAMGYTHNATVNATVSGEQRLRPQENPPPLVVQVTGQDMTDVRETIQTPVLMPKHLLAAMSEPNEFHKSAWPKLGIRLTAG